MPNRERYLKYRDKIREESRIFYWKNREKELERQRQWREQNLELKRQIMKESARRRRAEHPEITRAIQRKARENATPEQRVNRLAKIAAWHKAHRDEMLVRNRERWKRIDREKERIRNRNRQAWKKQAIGKYSLADIEALYEKQNGRCAACDHIFPETGKHRFEIDHIIPLKPRGATVPRGTNWPENLQLLCRKCNRSKSNRLPEEWHS